MVVSSNVKQTRQELGRGDAVVKMASLRPAKTADADAVLQLLSRFNNPDLCDEDFTRLFVDNSWCGFDYVGYMLEDEGNAVGFLAYTFSQRMIRGKIELLCSLSNWIVLEKYRFQSLSLLMPALRLPRVTLTSFTPIPTVYAINRNFGFEDLPAKQRIILPVPAFRWGKARTQVIMDATEIRKRAMPEQLRLMDDHSLPHHRYAMVSSLQGDSLLIMNRVSKRIFRNIRLPFIRIHHVGDPEICVDSMSEIVTSCARQFSVVGAIVDDRYLLGRPVPFSFDRPGHTIPAGFRSSTLSANDIDGLYSELVLLNY
jgi:acetoacetyl-CoA synthetase